MESCVTFKDLKILNMYIYILRYMYNGMYWLKEIIIKNFIKIMYI